MLSSKRQNGASSNGNGASKGVMKKFKESSTLTKILVIVLVLFAVVFIVIPILSWIYKALKNRMMKSKENVSSKNTGDASGTATLKAA